MVPRPSFRQPNLAHQQLPTITNNYFDAELLDSETNCAAGGTISGCTAINFGGIQPGYFKNNSTNAPFTSWNFTTIWQSNDEYPAVRAATLDELDPAVAPGVVSNVRTTPGDSRVNLAWDAPADDGGGEITDYQFSYRVHGETNWVDTHSNSPYTFVTSFGFTNGDHYDFRVAATNEAGTGPYVELLNQIIGTAPGAVQNLQAVNSNGQALVSWNIPTDTGSTPIYGYYVSYKLHESDTWSDEIGVASDSMAAGIDGLATGDYDFKVRARNENGYGDYASVSIIHIESQAYDITNCQQLQAIQNDTDGAYTLAQDIDCTGTNQWNTDGNGGFEGFEPISNFSGSLDGNNHSINGLYINRPGSCGQGIFDTLQSGSVVQDFAINNLSLTAGCDSAPLAAFADGGSTITNVSTSGLVAVSYGAGGIIGIAESEDEGDITISDSASSVTFAASNEDNQQTVGGIVGYVNSYRSTVNLLNNQVTMNASNSSANAYRIGGMTGGADLYDGGHLVIDGAQVDGAITAHNTLAGLVGEVDSSWSTMDDRPSLTITNSQVIMNMLGKGAVGGLVSYIEASGLDVHIENSSYLGYSEATENDNMGGLVGTMLDQGENPSLTIESSYVRAELNGTHYIGGLVGNTDVQATINNSYYQGTLTGGNWIGGLVGRGPVSIGHSYAAGAIDSSTGMQLGGLVGEMVDGLIGDSFASVSLNSSWLTVGGAIGAIDNGVVNVWIDSNIAGSSQCNTVYAEDGIIDYNCNLMNQDGSDSEYFRGNSTNTPLDTWDFDNIWQAQNGEYPILRLSNDESVYDISTCSELQGMNNDLDGDYQLMNNIDCSGTENWDDGQGFLPIASGHMEGFTGTLDGNGHTISNLTINRPDFYYVGLFEALNGTFVADFKLVNAHIYGGQRTGSVTATGYNAGIFEVNVTNSTVTSTGELGGEMDNGTGGIAGIMMNDDNVESGLYMDSFQGSVNGSYNVGGLAGVMGFGLVYDSYANADVSGAVNVGGLLGYTGFIAVDNSYAAGSVSATGTDEDPPLAGGLVGNTSMASVSDSFAANAIQVPEGAEMFGSGLIGTKSESNLSNNYANGSSPSGYCAPDTEGEGFGESEGCTAIDLTETPNYFLGNNTNSPLDQWNFEDIWKTNTGDLPTFQGQGGIPVYEITTCGELQGIDNDLEGDYTLMNDIDCSQADDFVPIGTDTDDGFTGSLDGNHYTINDLDMDRSEDGEAGLFSWINSATISRLTLTGSDMTGEYDAGAIAAYSDNSTLDQVSVKDAHIDTVVNDDGSTGGLIGYAYSSGDEEGGGYSRSSFEGTVEGFTGVGGLLGTGIRTSIYQSYANADVYGSGYVGGLTGYTTGYISQSYAAGSVGSFDANDNSSWAGGLVGVLGSGNIYDSFADNNTFTTNEDTNYANGLVGLMQDEGSSISNNYYRGITIEADRNYCTNDSVVSFDPEGCTAIDHDEQPDYFKNNHTNSPLDTWDFEDTWQTNETDYPTFIGQDQEPEIQCEEVTGTDTSVTISCTSTPDTWGETTWEMKYQKVGDSDWTTVDLEDPSLAQATITGLTPGTDYQVHFRFTNDWGTSDWGYIPYTTSGSKPTNPTPVTKPSAPATVIAAVILPATVIQQVTLNPEEPKTILDDFNEYANGKGIEFELSVGQIIYFYVGGEMHSATVKEIGNDYVILTIASTPFDVRINVGQAQEVSVLQNDTKDLRIGLTNVQNGKATVTFAHIKTTPAVAAASTPLSSNTAWWLLLLLIPVGYYLATHHDPKRRKHN